MANFFKTLIVVTLGIGLGLALTFFAVKRGVGFGAVHAGPWIGWPKAGSVDADPYSRAAQARDGETPLGAAEGLGFLARTDSAGAALDPRCDYVVGGAIPSARFWTLTVMNPEGRLVETAMRRYGFTSSEITRDADDRFDIVVSPSARPGNWLPIAPAGPFILVLRLYDTPASASAATLDAAAMPEIKRGRCP